MEHGHSGHDSNDTLHIIPVSLFTKVFAALIVLTGVTVGVAQVNFGMMNIVIAMLVASVKASLVIFFFMHGKYENKIVWTYMVIPFILLAIMIGGVFTDDPFRSRPQPVAVAGASS